MLPLGKMIDRLYQHDQVIDEIEAELRVAKQNREKLQVKLLKQFGAAKLNGATGTLGKARVVTTQYPSIADRRKFIKYVTQNKAWDLFQNRITSKAYFDRLEEGEEVPGVKVFPRTRVSVLKIKRR
jgi:hypothetical protein